MVPLFLATVLAAQLALQVPGAEANAVPEAASEPANEVPVEALTEDPAASEQAPATRPPPVRRTEGLFVRPTGQPRFSFVPWESEATANEVFERLQDRGGEVHFAPGNYMLHQGLVIDGVDDLTVSGSPGVLLEFAPGPEVEPRTTAPIAAGDRVIEVDRPDVMVAGWDYQLYAADGKGDRILEFTVASVEGDVVTLAEPAHYMPHVTEIPPGCQVLVEVNGFEVHKSRNLVLRNLAIEGHGRGSIRGHTIYSGVIAVGDYRAGRRPRVFGLEVSGCTFRGLMGRGVAVYGLDEVRIANNYFNEIRAQAIEIDHFASGHVLYNCVDRAQSGVTLNDSFEALVEGNALLNCDIGVYFMKIYDQRWVNTDNQVFNNTFGPGCVWGVAFRDHGIEGNLIRGNRFVDLPERFRVVMPKDPAPTDVRAKDTSEGGH